MRIVETASPSEAAISRVVWPAPSARLIASTRSARVARARVREGTRSPRGRRASADWRIASLLHTNQPFQASTTRAGGAVVHGSQACVPASRLDARPRLTTQGQRRRALRDRCPRRQRTHTTCRCRPSSARRARSRARGADSLRLHRQPAVEVLDGKERSRGPSPGYPSAPEAFTRGVGSDVTAFAHEQ